MPKEEIPRGQLSCVILSTLLKQDKYGYEIIDEVLKNSQGKISIKQPSLYSSLKRMEEQSLISSYWRDSDIGGKRHYYHLTDLGKKHLERWQSDYDDIYKVNTSIETDNFIANNIGKVNANQEELILEKENIALQNSTHMINAPIIEKKDDAVLLDKQTYPLPDSQTKQDQNSEEVKPQEVKDDGVFITERLNPEDMPKPAKWDSRRFEVYVAGNSVSPDLKRSKQNSYEDRVKDLYEKSKANAENQELELIDNMVKFASYKDLQAFYAEQNIKFKPYQKILKKTEKDYNMVRITKLNMLTCLCLLGYICLLSLGFGIGFSFSNDVILNHPITFIVFPTLALFLFIYSLILYLRAPHKRVALDLTKFKPNLKFTLISLLIIPIVIAINIICGFTFNQFAQYAITLIYPSLIALSYFVYLIFRKIILKTNSVF